MSATRTHNFAPAPTTARAQYTQLSADPKGLNIVYTNGRSVYVRNLQNPEQAWEYTGHSATATVARFAPSGFYIASGDVNGNVRIWDTINDEHISKLEVRPISGKINDIAWDSESKRIIAVGDGREKYGHAFLFDTGSSVGEIGGHSKAINGVSIRPVRPFRAATASEDGTVNFFNGVPYKLATTLKDHTRFVHAAKFSNDGKYLVTVGADGKIFLYKGDTGEKVGDLNGEGAHKGSILAVSWSPDSKHIVTSSADCTAKIWDVEAKTLVQTVTFSDKSTFLDQQVGNVWTAAGFIVSLSLSGELNYLEIGKDRPIRVVPGHQRGITAITKTSPTQLYTASFDGKVFAWSTAAGAGVAQQVAGPGHSNQVNDMAVVAGKVVTVAMDDTVRFVAGAVFDPAFLSTKTIPKAISSSGPLALIASIGELSLLRNQSLLSVTSIPYGGSAAALSPVASTAAVGGEDGKVHLYAVDGTTGALKETGTLDKNKAPVTAVAYSPDGKLVAVADSQRKILVYDVASGEVKIEEWVFHTARVNSIAWSPSGKNLVSGSLDTNVIVWNVAEPSKIITIKAAHLEAVNGVVFLDDETVATGGQDGALRVWKIKA